MEGAVDHEEQSKRDGQQCDLRSAARRQRLVDDAPDYESREYLEHPAGCREEQVPQQPASIRLGEAPGAAKHGGVQREAAKAVGIEPHRVPDAHWPWPVWNTIGGLPQAPGGVRKWMRGNRL